MIVKFDIYFLILPYSASIFKGKNTSFRSNQGNFHWIKPGNRSNSKRWFWREVSGIHPVFYHCGLLLSISYLHSTFQTYSSCSVTLWWKVIGINVKKLGREAICGIPSVPINSIKCLLFKMHHFKVLRRKIIQKEIVQKDEFGRIV